MSFHTTCTTSTTSSKNSESWEKAHYLSLTLWDIEREFQKSSQAYEQWRGATRQKKWNCFGRRRMEDELAKHLKLGRQVRESLEKGIDAFGTRFEQGDSSSNTCLSAQLLRVQHEVRIPLENCSLIRARTSRPLDALLTAAKGIRRACFQALQDQYIRFLSTPKSKPILPPPRFSVDFCQLASQLQKEPKSTIEMNKVRPRDRHDEREICTHCYVLIPVTMHTGLPNYRRLLYESHLAPETQKPGASASFACQGCYKTFEDPYAFLDHAFQKEIGSQRSCQKRWTIQLDLSQSYMDSSPALVDKCLKNCLKRESTRAKALRQSRDLHMSDMKLAVQQSVSELDANRHLNLGFQQGTTITTITSVVPR